MRVLNLQIFDAVISGTSTSWLSDERFNGAVGRADAFSIQAITTGVTGTGPTLTIESEHSCDGENWIATNSDFIVDTPIVEDASYNSFSSVCGLPTVGAFVRFRITLGGTSPSCRLTLYATGREAPA